MNEKLINKIISSVGSVVSLYLHTVFFGAALSLCFVGFEFNSVLLILTTVVSLEAIYLSLLIQISVNLQSKKIEEIQEELVEIQEELEIQEEPIETQED